MYTVWILAYLVQESRSHQVLDQSTMSFELRIGRFHRDMMVRHKPQEDIAEVLAAIKLLRPPQHDVLTFAKVGENHPRFCERVCEDLENRGDDLSGVQGKPAQLFAGFLLVLA